MTAIAGNSPLCQTLDQIKAAITAAPWSTVTTITTDRGIHTVDYVDADDIPDGDGAYALIGFPLPDHVYAEIDGATYGTLIGLRIYRDDLPT